MRSQVWFSHSGALRCIARHIALQAGRKLKNTLAFFFFFFPILLGFFSSIYLQLCRSTATPLRATNLIPLLAEVPALTKDFLDARSKSVCFMRALLLTATFSQWCIADVWKVGELVIGQLLGKAMALSFPPLRGKAPPVAGS